MIGVLRRNGRLTRNILGTVILRGSSILLGLAVMPAYLRFFPDRAVLGAWFTVLSVFNLVMVFDFGVGNGLRTRIVKPLLNHDNALVRRLIASTYAVSLAIGMFAFIVGFAIVVNVDWNRVFETPPSLVTPELFDAVMLILLGGVVLQLVLRNTVALLYALQWNNIANSMSVISTLSLLIFLLTTRGGSLATDLLHLSMANVLANTIPVVVATLWLFHSRAVGPFPRLGNVDAPSIKSVLGIGSIFLGIQFGLIVISSTDPILISALLAPAYVVEYQAYVKIFGLFSMAFSLLTQPVWSAVAQAHARDDLAWIRRASRLLFQTALVGAAASLLAVAALPWIFRIWLGPGVVNVSYPIALVCAGLAIADMLTLAVTCIANGLGELRVQLLFILIGALVKVPLSLLFVSMFGGWISVMVAHLIVILPLVTAQAIALRRRFGRIMPAGQEPVKGIG